MGYTQPYAKHRDYIKGGRGGARWWGWEAGKAWGGGEGGGGLSHPSVKGAARRASVQKKKHTGL